MHKPVLVEFDQVHRHSSYTNKTLFQLAHYFIGSQVYVKHITMKTRKWLQMPYFPLLHFEGKQPVHRKTAYIHTLTNPRQHHITTHFHFILTKF